MSHDVDRLMHAHEAAWRLGYRAIAAPPVPRSKAVSPAELADRRAMNAFYRAVSSGDVPPPDFYRGDRPLWRESTIRKVIAEGGGKAVPTKRSRRGRPMKAAAVRTDSTDTEGEAHA